jgi:hypothetical protein
MKLLLCSGCRDVVALQMDAKRTCRCGSSSGQYRADGWGADVWGPQAVLLGLRNQYIPALILGQGVELGQEYVTVAVYAIPPWDRNAFYHDEEADPGD